jgi:hypothetical protein
MLSLHKRKIYVTIDFFCEGQSNLKGCIPLFLFVMLHFFSFLPTKSSVFLFARDE